MGNKLVVFLLAVLLPVAGFGEAPAVKPDHPDSYTVVKGDTLWDISGRFLQEPWRWPEVWEANPQIANPHLIYPGDRISLVYRDGRPVLEVSRGAGGPRYVRLSPEVREYAHDGAVPAIPMEAIRPFLSQPLVVSKDEMDAWPYVVSSYDQHLIAGPGNKIYVRGLPEEPLEHYSVYRRGPAYVLPDEIEEARQSRALNTHTKYSDTAQEGEILGYQALYVGDVVVRRSGDPASAVITTAKREVQVGDRLLPQSDDAISGDLIPKMPAQPVDGKVVSVIDGVSEISNYQVVVLSVGADHGVENGSVLGVYQTGRVVRDQVAAKMRAEATKAERLKFKYEDESPVDSALSNFANDVRDTKRAFDSHMEYFGQPQTQAELVELPPEFAGVVMVFRTFDKVSYGLVMDTERSIHVYDTVSNL